MIRVTASDRGHRLRITHTQRRHKTKAQNRKVNNVQLKNGVLMKTNVTNLSVVQFCNKYDEFQSLPYSQLAR